MATQVQNRRGSTAEHSTFTGAAGELTVDTDKDTVVVHDGSTAGGAPLMREDGSNSALALGSADSPSLKWDSNSGIYSPGADQLAIATNGTGRLLVDASGNVGIGTSSPQAKLDVNGDIQIADGGSIISNAGNVTISADASNAAATSVINFNVDGLEAADINNAGYLRFSKTNFSGGGVCTQELNSVLSLGGGSNTLNSGLNLALSGPDRVNQWGYLKRWNTNSLYGWNKTDDAHIWYTGSSSERFRIDSSGRLLVGTSSDSGGALLQVNGNRIRVATAKTPASASDTGTAGEICWDASYIYVCTATNTWKRTAISTW